MQTLLYYFFNFSGVQAEFILDYWNSSDDFWDSLRSSRSSQSSESVSLFPWGRFLRGGDASFQVVWRTDLEVDLERTQNYFVELLALYLRRIII